MTIQSISQGYYEPRQVKNMFLNQTQQNANSIATGTRLNQASSGASEMAIYEKMTAQMRGLQQGIQNTETMSNLVNTAQGGLTSITGNLQRMRELSLAASNGMLGTEDRAIIQNEISQLMSGINDVASSTQFNGMKLLNGTFTNKHTASYPNGGGKEVSIGNMSLGGLNLTGYNVTGNIDVSQIDQAINQVTGTQARLGAMSNSFLHTINSNAIAEMNLASARSRFADTNIAKAYTTANKSRIMSQYQILMQKNSMTNAQNTLMATV